MTKLKRLSKENGYEFSYHLGFAYIGKRVLYDGKSIYQIGIKFLDVPYKHFNFKRKPWIKNLVLLQLLLFPISVLYTVGLFLLFILACLKYAFFGYFKHAKHDWGWNDNYVLGVVIFWKLISLIFITLFFLK